MDFIVKDTFKSLAYGVSMVYAVPLTVYWTFIG